MALKPPKSNAQPLTDSEPVHNIHICGQTAIDIANIEDLLADSLLDSIDWQEVKALMIEKAKAKFWQWISAAAPVSDISLALQPDAIAIAASEVES